MLCPFAGLAIASPEAEGLFREGRSLMKAGQLDAACDRFARSQKLEPSVTTLLNLGDCHERAGRTATAWDTFLQAKRLAEITDKRRAEAERRATALEPQLARLTITIDGDHQARGLVILRNRKPVDPAAWNTAVPIDPATYQIEARAPGRKGSTTTSAIAPKHSAVVVVSELVIDPDARATKKPEATTPKQSEQSVDGRGGRSIGLLFGAGEVENALLGMRALATTPAPGGQARAIASAHFTRYVDGPKAGVMGADVRTDTIAIGVGVEYIYYLVPQFGFGGGLGVGVDLDFPRDRALRIDDKGGSDVGAWIMARASPIVFRVTRTLEASFEVQLVRGGNEYLTNAIATIDWFVW